MIFRPTTLFAIVLVSVLLPAFQYCQADPTLPALFTDHMVLQRDCSVHVWGMADVGEAVTISLNGQSVKAITDNDGQWSVKLDPMKAGGPFTLTVVGKKRVAIHDVMIGEVWIASGQSNMNYELASSAGAASELHQAYRPNIRLFKVPLHSSLKPLHTIDSSWKVCTPDAAKDFSAVAYYFARDLNIALNIPIGIIQTSWSGSLAEEWTDAESLENRPELQPIVERWRQKPSVVKDFAQNGGTFDLQFDDFQFLPAKDNGHSSPRVFASFDDGQARTVEGGYWQTSLPGTMELSRPGRRGSEYAAHFSGNTSLEALPTLRASLHGGGSAEDATSDLQEYSGLRFYARGRGCFHTYLAEPTILDGDNYSTQPVCVSKEWSAFTVHFGDLRQAGWGVKKPLTLDLISSFVIETNAGIHEEGERPPSGLYNGMIEPLTPFTIRGAIWYQGEGNSGRAYQYRTLLPAMIEGWRRAWKEGSFPFLIVQLPNLGSPNANAEKSNWAELREAQLQTSNSLPATGLAVTIDLGEAANLHPPRKAEVGQRLALSALGPVYGRLIEYSGPHLLTSEAQGSSIRLSFSHAAGLRARDGSILLGFAVAGADKHFVPAEAEIENSSVIVSSPIVLKPVAVRYAWAGNPICNLVNSSGLPASPFRTDDWPISTQERR